MTSTISSNKAVVNPYVKTPQPMRRESPPILPTDLVQIGAAAPETRGVDTRRAAGVGLMLALSLAGMAVAAPSAQACVPPPTTVSTTLTQDFAVQETHMQILAELQEKGELRTAKSETDGDKFGKKISASEAMKRLEQGEAIVVRARIGSPRYFEQPFPINDTDIARNTKYEGVRVSSLDQLSRLNAASRLTAYDTSSALSQEERDMARQLQLFEGGVPGGSTHDRLVYRPGGPWHPGYPGYPGFPGGNWEHVWDFVPDDPMPALYSQEWKGGLFGIGQHQDRITAYEAVNELQAGRPLTVRTREGQVKQVNNAAELRAAYNLELR
ncbi:MAG: hypothetical protein FJX76_21680 [Armatimonadetes bacterium]|nr:hypothetical protein [Armatimonadota bacterium]